MHKPLAAKSLDASDYDRKLLHSGSDSEYSVNGNVLTDDYVHEDTEGQVNKTLKIRRCQVTVDQACQTENWFCGPNLKSNFTSWTTTYNVPFPQFVNFSTWKYTRT